jgi:hypothetical protein
MKNKLVDSLTVAGKTTEIWNSSDGSVVLVLPYGGRILGLFAPESAENFLWTHPELDHAETAQLFYKSNEWHNSGGDRTWLSPEVDFFLPKFPQLDVYVQPREFDPGQYQLTREDGTLALNNRFSSRLSRSGATVKMEITKRLSGAQNPLRSGDSALDDEFEYAGYTLRTRLAFTSGRCEPAAVGLWSLIQFRHGGELLIPTFSKPRIKTYFGKVSDEDLKTTERLIRYHMHAAGEHKIGVEAPFVTGRVGYLRRMADRSSLIIRNFSVNPSGEYIDVPWGDTACPGAAVEACNVDSKLGSFSELEYHVPAIGGSTGKWCSEDESQVWAFRGPEETIVRVARLLLSPES